MKRSTRRLLTYPAAIFCGILLWIGLASPASDWHRPLGLIAGILGLIAVTVILLRGRL